MNRIESLEAILSPFLIGLLITAGIGLVIGLEREFNTHDKPSHIGGIRTFMLTAILGYCAGWIGQLNHPEILIAVLAGFFVLIGIAYYAQTTKGNLGLTTEVALVMTLILGVIVSTNHVREALALVVLTTLVLSLKTQLHGFIQRWTEEELFAFIKFTVMALLILPSLPDQPFGPEGLLNLRDLGWIVVLVLSISFAGYLLLKFGNPHKGILWTALIGGLFSSTLIAWVFSNRSRERRDLSPAFGSGIVLASSVMFVRVFVLTSVFAFPVALNLAFPLFLMLLVSLLPARKVLESAAVDTGTAPLLPGNPLDVKNALYFVLLYIGITFLMFGSRQWLDQRMVYLSGAAAGIADIDAITISTAKWASGQAAVHRQAAAIILLAVLSNSLFKLLVSLFTGSAELRKSVLLGFGLVLTVGLGFLGYWLWIAV